MSVAGIMSTAALSVGAQFFQSRARQMRNELQQLGTDLQSGNLTAAQSDFAALQKLQPQPPTTASSQGSSITQDFNQLAADLKAGNPTAAQTDFTKLQQDFERQQTQGHLHYHHHHSSVDGGVSQLFGLLASALQSGNMNAAQQSYSAMLQGFQQYGSAGTASSQASTISVSA